MGGEGRDKAYPYAFAVDGVVGAAQGGGSPGCMSVDLSVRPLDCVDELGADFCDR